MRPHGKHVDVQNSEELSVLELRVLYWGMREDSLDKLMGQT